MARRWRRSASDPRLVEKVVRIGLLLDVYGELLTDKQRQFIKMHYGDDLSFGEIAKEFNISRQAIHDAVKHAERSLEEYESKLGLLRRRQRSRPGEGADLDEDRTKAVAAILEDVIKRLKGAGIIYNPDWIVSELRRAIGLLAREAGSAGEDELQAAGSEAATAGEERV